MKAQELGRHDLEIEYDHMKEDIAELEARLADERLDREGLVLVIEENRELKQCIAELEAERGRLLAIVSKIADAQGLEYEAFGDAIYDLILEARAALVANEG